MAEATGGTGDAPNVNKLVDATEQELLLAFAGPAVHANKVVASNLGAGLRIAFLEYHPSNVATLQFRTAAVLSYTDAVQLRDLLSRQLKDFEAAIAIDLEIGPDGKATIKKPGG